MYGIPDKPAPCNSVISLVTSGHGYDGVDAIQHGTATKSTLAVLHRRTAVPPPARPFLPLFPLAVATRRIYNATVNTGDDAPGARQQVECRGGEACFVH